MPIITTKDMTDEKTEALRKKARSAAAAAHNKKKKRHEPEEGSGRGVDLPGEPVSVF